MKSVLHVGCGSLTVVGHSAFFPTGDWRETRLDIDPAARPDVLASMTDMPAVGDSAHDAVYSRHNLEHLFPHELQAALGEFRRVLRPGGFLLAIVPDIQQAAAAIAAGKADEPLYLSPGGPVAPLDVLYGHRASLARGQAWMAHRNGFLVATLVAAIGAAGFTAVHAKRQHFDIVAMGFKDRRPVDGPRLSGRFAVPA